MTSTASNHRVWRVVDGDNFCGDYPNEKFVGPNVTKAAAEKICEILNAETGPNPDRWYRVEHESYKLQPGFQP